MGIAHHARRKLRCKNHKCPSLCHRGVCAPCPVMVTIACLCGVTHFEVPCGTEMDQKPPRCRKPCPITPLCRHGPNSKPHKCHYGACHPCKLLCEKEYPCGHKCQLRCHGPKPPSNPEFTLKPKKKKSFHPPECTPGSPCPPCPELVWRSCVGQHFAADRMMVCSDKSLFFCDNLCGNPLPCGNHFCTITCHPLKNQSLPSGQQARSEPCEVCHLPCEKERAPAFCLKRSKQLFVLVRISVIETCHPGQCPSPEKCSKKVTVRCGCQTLKREWLCYDVQAACHNAGTDPKDITKNQFGLGLLPCDSNCKSKQKIVDSELHSRRPKVVEVKEPDTDKPAPKRKRRREGGQEMPQISTLQKILAHVKQFLLVATLLVLLVAASYYGYKGLLRLSDWMNEVEEKKAKRTPSYLINEGNTLYFPY
ncbi:hypothetical protein ACLB2K_071458 [Fragaria x ananassa]